MLFCGKPETIPQSTCTGLHCVATSLFQFHQHAGQFLTLGITACCYGIFQPSKALITIHHVIQGGTLRARRFLCDMRNTHLLLQADTARVGFQYALDHGEQTGLASTVGTSQTDFLSRMNDSSEVTEQAFTVTSARDIIETEHAVILRPVHPNALTILQVS
jgi:hypothetical protein